MSDVNKTVNPIMERFQQQSSGFSFLHLDFTLKGIFFFRFFVTLFHNAAVPADWDKWGFVRRARGRQVRAVAGG